MWLVLTLLLLILHNAHTGAFVYLCLHVCIDIHEPVCAPVYMCTCVCKCVGAYWCTCLCTCVCVCVLPVGSCVLYQCLLCTCMQPRGPTYINLCASVCAPLCTCVSIGLLLQLYLAISPCLLHLPVKLTVRKLSMNLSK